MIRGRRLQKRAVPAQWQDNFSYSLFPKKLSGVRKHLSLGCLEPQKIHSLNYRFGYKHVWFRDHEPLKQSFWFAQPPQKGWLSRLTRPTKLV